MRGAQFIPAAIDLARCGMRPVSALARNKGGALKGWPDRASLDRHAIEALFADAPYADAIAIATGEGVFVVDLDRNHGDGADGVKSFARLARAQGEPIPRGPRVRTPKGGFHLYFACDPSRRVRNRAGLAPGVDVRGQGGLALCPPTMRDGVAYRWAPAPWERAIPQAPAWLLDLLAPVEAPRAPAGPVKPYRGDASAYARAAFERELASVANAPKGTRNATLFKASAALGSLCAAALPEGGVKGALFEAARASGLVGDDGRDAVEATIARGMAKGRARPRALPARAGGRA